MLLLSLVFCLILIARLLPNESVSLTTVFAFAARLPKLSELRPGFPYCLLSWPGRLLSLLFALELHAILSSHSELRCFGHGTRRGQLCRDLSALPNESRLGRPRNASACLQRCASPQLRFRLLHCTLPRVLVLR